MRITAVVPTKNKASVLAECFESIRVAAQAHPGTSVIIVDNGSTDGSLEIANRFRDGFRIVHSDATRIGAVRNQGARLDPDTEVFAFIDCDCVVPPDFFSGVEQVLNASGAQAVGCEVTAPADGHWSEVAWNRLHRPGGDGPRHYINSACFCMRSEWFWKIQGFDEQKISSEDVDICWRLTEAGGTMFQSERLAVVHMGNPKTVGDFYRRLRWHGEGIWEPGKGVQWSVTTISTLLHPIFIAMGVAFGVFVARTSPWLAIACVAIGLVAMPTIFVIARIIQRRRRVPFLRGIALMFISFTARLNGIIKTAMHSAPAAR